MSSGGLLGQAIVFKRELQPAAFGQMLSEPQENTDCRIAGKTIVGSYEPASSHLG
jgi:hypothetical protein